MPAGGSVSAATISWWRTRAIVAWEDKRHEQHVPHQHRGGAEGRGAEAQGRLDRHAGVIPVIATRSSQASVTRCSKSATNNKNACAAERVASPRECLRRKLD